MKLRSAFVSGTLAAAATTVVASLLSRRNTGSTPAALNATSHFLWGDRARRRYDYSSTPRSRWDLRRRTSSAPNRAN